MAELREIARGGEQPLVPPRVPPLEPVEIDYYEWIIDGLLAGVAAKLRKDASRHQTLVYCDAVEEARDLFAELMVRVREADV